MTQNIEATPAVPASDAYERDFYSWTQEQAKLLRSGQFDALDITNILEEIETLGRSERASLKSAYRLICFHLLKMKYQPETCTRSWYDSVDRERGEVADILSENPGLRPFRDDAFSKAYALARGDAKRGTGLAETTFAKMPPFRREECETPGFLPQEMHDQLAAQASSVGSQAGDMGGAG